jgi:rubredoxin
MIFAEYRQLADTERGRCAGCREDLPTPATCPSGHVPKSVIFPLALTGIITDRKPPAVSLLGLCPACYADLLERSRGVDPSDLRKERARSQST